MSKKDIAKTIFIIIIAMAFAYFLYLHIPYSRSGYQVHKATNMLYTFTWEEDGIRYETDQPGEATYLTPLQYEIKKCYGNEPKRVDYPVKRINIDGRLRTVSDLKITDVNVIHYRVARLGIFDKTECFGISMKYQR